MRLPIDTARLKFLVVADAEPLRQFEEGKPQGELGAPDGHATARCCGGCSSWRWVRVRRRSSAWPCRAIRRSRQGEMVAVDGLTAQAWELPDGRSGMSFRARAIRSAAGREGGGRVVMAIDDLLDRARDARRRRDEAASELVALVRALEGLEGVGMLDGTQKRELGRLRDRPRATRVNGASRASRARGRGRDRDALDSSRAGAGGGRSWLAGVLGGLWRWRVELALLTLGLLVWRVLAGPLGAVPAVVLVAWAVSGLLVLAPARALLVRTLRVRRLRRRFRRGWIDAGLPAVALGRLRPVPAGEVAAIRVASGGSIEDLEARRERLAASIRVRELRVTRDPARRVARDGDLRAP